MSSSATSYFLTVVTLFNFVIWLRLCCDVGALASSSSAFATTTSSMSSSSGSASSSGGNVLTSNFQCPYTLTVSALSAASDSLLQPNIDNGGTKETSSTFLVSPGDVVTMSTNSTWCIGGSGPLCSNAAGASTQYSTQYFYHGREVGALVLRYGNATTDENDADWITAYPLIYPPQTFLTVNLTVPHTVPNRSLMWFGIWDDGVADNSGSLVLNLTHYTPAPCPPPIPDTVCTTYGDLAPSSYTFDSSATAYGSPNAVFLRNLLLPSLPAGPASAQLVSSLQILLDTNTNSFNMTLALYAVNSSLSQFPPMYSLLTVSLPIVLVTPAANVYTFPVNPSLPAVYLNTSLSYAVGVYTSDNSYLARFVVLDYNLGAPSPGANPFPSQFTPTVVGIQLPMAMTVCSAGATATALGSPVVAGTRGISPQGGCVSDHQVPNSGCITTAAWGDILLLFPTSLAGFSGSFWATTIVFPQGYYGSYGSPQHPSYARLGLYRQVGSSSVWDLLGEGNALLQYTFDQSVPYVGQLVKAATLTAPVLLNPLTDSIALAYWCGMPCYEIWYDAGSDIPGYGFAGIPAPSNQTTINQTYSQVTVSSNIMYGLIDIYLLGNTVSPAAAPVMVSSSSGSSSISSMPSSSSSSTGVASASPLSCNVTFSIQSTSTVFPANLVGAACAYDHYAYQPSSTSTLMWTLGGEFGSNPYINTVYSSNTAFTSLNTSTYGGTGTYFGGSAFLSNGNLLYITGKYNQNNQPNSFSPYVYVSTNQGASFTVSTVAVPFVPRSDLCSTSVPNTNIAIICKGQGYVAASGTTVALADCWMSSDGRGAVWTQQVAVGPVNDLRGSPCVALFDAQPEVGINATFILTSYDSSSYWISHDYAMTFGPALTAPWSSNLFAIMAVDVDSYVYMTGTSPSTVWVSVNKGLSWQALLSPTNSPFTITTLGADVCIGVTYTHNAAGAVTRKGLVLYGGTLDLSSSNPGSLQGLLQFNCVGGSSSSSTTSSPSSSVPPIPVTPPVFSPSSVTTSCLILSTPTVTTGTTALISLTDSCALSSLTVAELELYEVAAVCRFLPSGVQSPAVLHLNTSSGTNVTTASTVVILCPLPAVLSAGVYTVQLSLDGGMSVPLPVLTSTSIASSTLTVVASSASVASDFSVTSLPQHPFNAAIDPLPAGFNRNDTLLFNFTVPALSNLTFVTLTLEVTFLQFNSSSARTAPIIVSQSALIIASYLTLLQSPFTWVLPDLQGLVLQRLQVPLSRLIAFSVGAYYTPSSSVSSGSIKSGDVPGVGFYDQVGLVAPSEYAVMGAVLNSNPGPLVASSLSSFASSILSLTGISSIHALLSAASGLEAAADLLGATSSPVAAAAYANASQAVQVAAEAIAVFGAQLNGGALYAARTNLSASLAGSLLSPASGASVGGAGGACTSLFGDVHLLTFDGVHYDFQGVGVYWLMQTPTPLYPQYGVSGFSLQMYLQPLSSNIQPGTAAALAWSSVTYMAGIALQADSLCGNIQVIPRQTPSQVTGSYLDVYDANVYVNVPYSTAGVSSSYQLSCATLFYMARDTLTLTTYTGYTVTITALDGIARLSTLQVCVPSSAYNNTEGMLGSWDGNSYNDFVSAQGVNEYTKYLGNVGSTTITAGNTGPNDAAGYAAGQTWVVQPLDSFIVSVGPPQVGCNITEDDSTALTEVCLLSGQRQSSNLLLYDVNVTQILLAFNPANLPYVPLTWPDPIFQQQATTACVAATGGQPINSTAVADCLADAYYSNSTSIATTPTTIVQAQQLVQSILPPTLSLATLTLSTATVSVSGQSSSTTAGGACTQLSLAPLINATAGVQCIYVMQLSVEGAAFTPLNLSSASLTGSSTFTLALPGLVPGITYSVRAALQVTVASSQTTATTSFSSLSLSIPTVQSASLCVLMYGLPGNVDYPWSSAVQLQVVYNSTVLSSSSGKAVSIINGTGLRTFTNRFGVSMSTSLTLSSCAINSLYIDNPYPVDSVGLTLNLSSPVQLPGVGPSSLFSTFSLHNTTSGAVVEGDASSIDSQGEAYLSSIPGFLSVTIGASNVNSLAALYATCQAPITFTNGLRPPTQPSVSNGALHFTYSYTLSDGVSYVVQTNLSITTTSAFATTQDQLGNPYQTIQNITGTRHYTYLPTSASLISHVTFTAPANFTQRFYPYALLSSAPGVYSVNTAPYLDAEGLTFSISPASPANGLAPGAGVQQSSVSVHVVAYNNTVTQLNELAYNSPPLPSLQLQQYTLM